VKNKGFTNANKMLRMKLQNKPSTSYWRRGSFLLA